MKRLFLVLLALILAGCTTFEEMPTEPTEVIEIEKNEPFNVMVKTIYSQESEGNKTVFESEIDNLVLEDSVKEKYPLLAKSIEEENQKNIEYAMQDYDAYLQDAKENYFYGDEYFAAHDNNIKASVKRSDEKAFSVTYCYNSYTGGMHPNYYYDASNFESKSGKKLTLGDVFTDVTKLSEIVRNELIEKYGVEAFFDIETEEFSGLTASNTNAWTIGYDRVTFYFSPYELAPYAAGLITAELFFTDYSDIINEEFTVVPKGYAVEITDDWNGYVCDLNPEKEGKDIINIIPEYQDDMYGRIILELNSNGYGHDTWFYDSREFFVHLEENGVAKNYIYIETISDNDYPTILAFNVGEKNISFIGEIPGTGFVSEYEDDGLIKPAFTNPYNFTLGTRMDMLSTYSGLKTYYADFKTGMPKADMEYYNIDVDYVLKNLVPVKVLVLPEKVEETIPEGESFTFLRTDNETYVDMKLSDSREVKIMVEMIDGWMACVEGKPAWDVFSGTVYAG